MLGESCDSHQDASGKKKKKRLMEIVSLESVKAEQKLLNKNNNPLVFQQSFLCNTNSHSHGTGAVLEGAECRKEK